MLGVSRSAVNPGCGGWSVLIIPAGGSVLWFYLVFKMSMLRGGIAVSMSVYS